MQLRVWKHYIQLALKDNLFKVGYIISIISTCFKSRVVGLLSFRKGLHYIPLKNLAKSFYAIHKIFLWLWPYPCCLPWAHNLLLNMFTLPPALFKHPQVVIVCSLWSFSLPELVLPGQGVWFCTTPEMLATWRI